MYLTYNQRGGKKKSSDLENTKKMVNIYLLAILILILKCHQFFVRPFNKGIQCSMSDYRNKSIVFTLKLKICCVLLSRMGCTTKLHQQKIKQTKKKRQQENTKILRPRATVEPPPVWFGFLFSKETVKNHKRR